MPGLMWSAVVGVKICFSFAQSVGEEYMEEFLQKSGIYPLL